MKILVSNTIVLRSILLLVGVAVVLLGLNVGLGGIKTLGWQVAPDFITVTDHKAYSIQDNHVRFLGGFWLGAGLMFIAAARWLDAMRPALFALIAMIFTGGLARLFTFNTVVLLEPDVLQSITLELAGFPLLGFWLYRLRDTSQGV